MEIQKVENETLSVTDLTPLENYSGCDGIIVAYFRFIETGEML